MKWISGLIRKKKVAVFINYEYWFRASLKQCFRKPELKKLCDEIEKKYLLKDIKVFADFSDGIMQNEVDVLRESTGSIISLEPRHCCQKDFLIDFGMLDSIYQYEAEHPKICSYILLTGSDCFRPVVEYLIQKRNKAVTVIWVGECNLNLKAMATTAIGIPSEDYIQKRYFRMIIRNLEYVKNKSGIIPTFLTTVKSVAKYNSEPEHKIHSTLQEMIKRGLVVQKERNISGKRIKIIDANWYLANAAGLTTLKQKTI